MTAGNRNVHAFFVAFQPSILTVFGEYVGFKL